MNRYPSMIGVLALLLAGCAATDTATEQAPPAAAPTASTGLLAEHGLDGTDVVGLVDHLDRLGGTDRPSDLVASVRPDEVVLSDGEQELALDLPDDLFYLSVAPYADQTHECFYHSLTTCQGELGGQEVDVRIVDGSTGAVLVDETVTTFDNGFVGFWLPRDIEGTVEVEHEGRSGSVDFTTTDEGATCLTTLRVLPA